MGFEKARVFLPPIAVSTANFMASIGIANVAYDLHELVGKPLASTIQSYTGPEVATFFEYLIPVGTAIGSTIILANIMSSYLRKKLFD